MTRPDGWLGPAEPRHNVWPGVSGVASKNAGLSPSLATATATLAIGFGLAGDSLFNNAGIGIGFSIWIATFAFSVVALAWRAERVVGRESVCWLLAAIAFASALAWRDSDTLRVLNVGATALTLALAGLTIHDERASVFRDRLGELIASLVAAAFAAFTGALAFLFRDLRAPAFQSAWAQHISRIARVVLIVGGILLVFGSLLRGADPVFASLTAFPSIDFETIMSHVMLTGVIAWIVLGWTRATLLEPADQRWSIAPPARLGLLDVTTTLTTLNVLFAAFVLAQLGALFGGEAFLRAKTGLTAAEYARQGFFQTVWVVVLVVPLLLATRAALRPDRDVARRHTALALPVVGLVAVIILSAMLRMRLYVQYFGLSEDRLYALVFLAWLGVVLVWLAATTLRGRDRAFVGGAAVSGLATLVALNVASPDAIVARVNLQRAAAAGSSSVDLAYMASLGGDAAPIVTDAVLAAPPLAASASDQDGRCTAARILLEHWGTSSAARVRVESAGGWRSWNGNERIALRAVATHDAALRAISNLGCKKAPRPADQR